MITVMRSFKIMGNVRVYINVMVGVFLKRADTWVCLYRLVWQLDKG